MEKDKEKEKLFQDPKWNGDTGTVVVEREEVSKEEREKSRKEFLKILKDEGIIWKLIGT